MCIGWRERGGVEREGREGGREGRKGGKGGRGREGGKRERRIEEEEFKREKGEGEKLRYNTESHTQYCNKCT